MFKGKFTFKPLRRRQHLLKESGYSINTVLNMSHSKNKFQVRYTLSNEMISDKSDGCLSRCEIHDHQQSLFQINPCSLTA